MRAPDRTETDDRTIRYQWVLSSEPHTDGEAVGVREHLAELRCTYQKGRGLTAVLHNRDTGHYTQRGYTMRRETIQVGGPPGVLVLKEDLARFSQKRLLAFAEDALLAALAGSAGTNLTPIFEAGQVAA